MRKILLGVATAGAILCAAGARAQSANPLAAPLPPPRLGAEVGVNVNQQSGTFTGNCDCPFSSGSGTSFFVSGIGEMHTAERIALMGRVSVGLMNLTSKTAVVNAQQVYDPVKDRIDTMVIPLDETATTRLTYLLITPMVRYDLLKSLFVAVGPSFGLALTSSLTVDEAIGQSGYTYLDGSSTRQLQNGGVPSLSAFRFSLSAMLGYEIPLSAKVVFVPTAAADFPLTNVASGTTWKIATYQIAGAVRWKLHL